MTESTIPELRARLVLIRAKARRRMEREIRRESEPVLAELAELTAMSRLLNRRNIRLKTHPVPAKKAEEKAKLSSRTSNLI